MEVASTAMDMKINPAVTIPNSAVYMTSLSSSGASVFPAIIQWVTCTTIRR